MYPCCCCFQTLPEREARALIAQVFAGLAYLNGKRPAGGEDDGPRVIHYDLKPANILFDSLGTVKITDFGLSKVSVVKYCRSHASRDTQVDLHVGLVHEQSSCTESC